MGGTLGEIFSSLAFASAFVAMVSFFFAEKQEGTEKQSWERMGKVSFGVHIASILGIIGTLFALIYQHQYQYHYVWAHSSNELPVYYMISCFWEGQEGSFLLWCFWNAILGGAVMWRVKNEWRNLVLAVIASVELILSSMILGIIVSDSWIYGIYLLMLLGPAAYLLYQVVKAPKIGEGASFPLQEAFRMASLVLVALGLLVLARGQDGFGGPWSIKQLFAGFDHFAFGLFVLGLWGYIGFYLVYVNKSANHRSTSIGDLIAGISIFVASIAVAFFEVESWKVGSNPFVLLKTVFPENPAFLADPDFVPTNGNGLNTLLQNYWMVIHPPTLFLGFSATVVPFAFVVAGLIKGKYSEWMRPATSWTLFAVMILGVGIIMGGYWAYETLNFGGYWNWDPVENGSLVPWLCGIAALHSMLVYRKTKSHLKMTMGLVMLTFLLVLYATFLTRSGILGDTSVHTFTDLGLSGQLLVLVLAYVAMLVVLMTLRWNDMPTKPDDSKTWSAEFFLFMGILVFVFSWIEIALSTSLPVFNKIFGTNMAPPAEIQLFYYKWNVWFAIAFGVLSGIGQFLWWRVAKKKSPAQALYRPFLLTMVIGSLVLILTRAFDMTFAYQKTIASVLDPALSSNFFETIMAYIEYGVMGIADELLLFSSLFVIFANTDVLLSLLKKNRKGLKVMGGTVAHIGFGFMLLGMLFSSGYDEVVSINVTPDQMAGFSDDEKLDNVRLAKGETRIIKGYKATYIGRKEAVGPISSLEVIEETVDAFKVRFRDATGDVFGYLLPRNVFLIKDSTENAAGIHPTSNIKTSNKLAGEIDLQFTEDFLNKNLEVLKPEHINNRTLYGIRFESLKDSTRKFVLYPEAEINSSMNGIIAHPSRKIRLADDLYVHVSQIPANEDSEPEFKYHDLSLRPGDTTYLGNIQLYFHNVTDLTKTQAKADLDSFQIALGANMLAIVKQDSFFLRPIYLIGWDNTYSFEPYNVEELHLDVALVRIDPEKELFQFQARVQTNPSDDFISFKAIRKPYINLLWLGTFILTFGFGIAIYRRLKE